LHTVCNLIVWNLAIKWIYVYKKFTSVQYQIRHAPFLNDLWSLGSIWDFNIEI
jgi:hypothetical protein